MNTILTVTVADIDRIDEEKRAVELLQQLLWAEAVRLGLPLANINISLATKTADGGVDATVSCPLETTKDDSLFCGGYNAYQIKAGKSFEPWKKSTIEKELFSLEKPPKEEKISKKVKPLPKEKTPRERLGSMVRDCLDRNGRFVLVCFGHDLTDEQRKQAKNHLETFFSKDCQYDKPTVDVWSRNNLISFLKPFPSLALALNQKTGGFQTHASWAKDNNMQLAFVPGENQQKQIQSLRDALRQKNFHVRIAGEPGIGKTRLAFEATKAENLKPLVVYCNADSFWGSELMFDMIRDDAQFHAILVIDECNSENRSLIANKLKSHSNRLQLITVYSDRDNVSDVNYLDVLPLDQNEITEIIRSYNVPEDVARQWTDVCDGSPRVAHVVGLNLSNNPDDMLRVPDTERVWERYIEGSDNPQSLAVQQRKLVLLYLSLFKRFGFGQPVQIEAQSIHKMIEQGNPAITWLQFVVIIKELRERKLLQGQTTLYITPKLLHIKLWIDWWDTYGSMVDLEPLLNISQTSLLDWFFEMFEYAAGSGAALRTVRALLGVEGLFQSQPELFKTERGARFFRYLGEVEPTAAIRCLQKTIGTWDRETLLEYESGRRDIIWFLENSAKWRSLFVPSANLLLALAEAENETWSNNASGIFAELFSIGLHPKLSMTEAPPSERFPVLENALNSTASARKKLALEACNQALSERTTGSVSDKLQVFGPVPNYWIPATWGELFDSYRQVWKLLVTKLDELTGNEHARASEILLQHVRNLGIVPSLAEMIASDVLHLATDSIHNQQSLLEIVAEMLRHRKDLKPEVRSIWEQVQNQLSGDDYHSSMLRYIRMNLLDIDGDDYQERINQTQIKIKGLAKESFAHPDLLVDELTWLVTTDATNGYQFGYALAQEDSSFSLLSKLLSVQKEAAENASLFFLGGYLRSLFENDQQAWEALMDTFALETDTSFWVLELAQRAGRVTNKAAKRILNTIRADELPARLFLQFMYGGMLNDLSEELFTEWIEFLLKKTDPTAVYVALGLYSMFYTRNEAKHIPPADLTVKLLTHEGFAKLPKEFQQGNNRTMYPFYWKLVADAFVTLYPNRSLELSAFILKYFNGYDTLFDHAYPRSMLRSILINHPVEVWKQIVPYLEASYSWALTHWLRGEDFFGSPRDEDHSALSHIPQEIVWQWVESDIKERAWFVATFVPPILDKANPQSSWVRELLVRYGQREDVRRNLEANFSSHGWLGNESDHLEHERQQLLTYRGSEINPSVNQWLDEYLERIERRIENARIEEERDRF